MKTTTENRINTHKHYVIIDALDIESLMMEVNDVLNTGEWAVSGGVFYNTEKKNFIQAMTRIKP